MRCTTHSRYHQFVPEFAFAQAERRSILLPIALAVAALLAILALGVHLFPSTAVHTTLIRTDVLATHTIFKSQSIVLGRDQAQDVLFVATTLRIENKLRVPISLDDFSLTLTNPGGAELIAKAIQKQDLPNVELSFPALRPLIPKPLVRETSIAPGQSSEGTLLFSLQIPKSVWSTRKSAVLRIEPYHQPIATLTLPNP